MGILYEESSFGVFLLLTCIIGGGTAFMSGRAVALTWKPIWQVALYMVPLAAAVRFFHFALFEGTLLTLHYYLVDYGVLLAAALVGFRMTRTTQMVTQYRWLYRRTSPFTWAERGGEA
ncbi:MAG TPA: hypothetical protein PLJ34_05655 [Hyphomicrobiales bacterium]|nr:hypothetical protein [Kaistiaceae bacterium]HQF30913.1 hypothetical protein [Hyphomicrobiales bacterium]